MKSQTIRNFCRVAKLKCVILIICTAGSIKGAAQKNEQRAMINYIGSEKGTITFQVQYLNESGKRFKIVIKGEENEILFSDHFKEIDFTKRFLFDNRELENKKITFIIQTSGEKKVETFEVNKVIVENMIVKKL